MPASNPHRFDHHPGYLGIDEEEGHTLIDFFRQPQHGCHHDVIGFRQSGNRQLFPEKQVATLGRIGEEAAAHRIETAALLSSGQGQVKLALDHGGQYPAAHFLGSAQQHRMGRGQRGQKRSGQEPAAHFFQDAAEVREGKPHPAVVFGENGTQPSHRRHALPDRAG